MNTKSFLKIIINISSIFTIIIVAIAYLSSSKEINFLPRARNNFSDKYYEILPFENSEKPTIYTGNLLEDKKESYVTLTLMDWNEYTLERVAIKDSITTLAVSTGTYTFSKLINPENPSLLLDILTLKEDKGTSPLFFILLKKEDSLLLIDNRSNYTGRKNNILKRENIKH